MRSVYSQRGRFLWLCVLLVVLAGCGAAPSGQTDTDTSASPVTDMNSLIAALQGNGLTVETAGTVSQPFFDVEGTQLRVEGADVQVFEFADAEAHFRLCAGVHAVLISCEDRIQHSRQYPP